MPAGAVCVAGLAGRQRQVGSAGIGQGAGSGGQRGQRKGHGLMVIVVMWLSVTDGSSIPARASCLSLSSSPSSSSTAHLQQPTCSVRCSLRNTASRDGYDVKVVSSLFLLIYSLFITIFTKCTVCYPEWWCYLCLGSIRPLMNIWNMSSAKNHVSRQLSYDYVVKYQKNVTFIFRAVTKDRTSGLNVRHELQFLPKM